MGKQRVPSFTYDVFSTNERRMAALEDLRCKMDSIAEDERGLKKQLLAAASPEARKYLRQTTIIEDLFAYGLADRKIDVGEYVGMNSAAAIKRILKSLNVAWSNAVSVKIVHSEGGRVEVKFRAIGY